MPDRELADQLCLIETIALPLGREVGQAVQPQSCFRALPSLPFERLDCAPRCRLSAALSMGEFLRRHQALLIERVRYWHGDIAYSEVARLLRYYRFVAETYGLVIPAADHRRALVELAMLVAFWAASRCGIGPMYDE